MSNTTPVLDDAALRAMAQTLTQKPCACAVGACPAWESVAEDRWPAAQMRKLGTLLDPDIYESTFEEYHPQGTRYDSVDAPIAAKFFPYNRCDAFACTRCERRLLRYTEFGGYYVDHRVRELRVELLVSAGSPQP
jgi:hypothetical protein